MTCGELSEGRRENVDLNFIHYHGVLESVLCNGCRQCTTMSFEVAVKYLCEDFNLIIASLIFLDIRDAACSDLRSQISDLSAERNAKAESRHERRPVWDYP